MQPLNIQIFVDVMALLLDNPTEGAVFAYDDSPVPSQNKGTPMLQTPVWPGQLVRWSLIALDVQTPAWIRRISFGANMASSPAPQTGTDTPWSVSWEGYMPCYGLIPGQAFPYQLEIGFGALSTRRSMVAGPSLCVMPLPWSFWSQQGPAPASTSAPIIDGSV